MLISYLLEQQQEFLLKSPLLPALHVEFFKKGKGEEPLYN